MVVSINSNEDIASVPPWRFLRSVVFVVDHFSADHAITPFNVTGHQLATLCSSICAEDRAKFLDPIVTSQYYMFSSTYIILFLFCFVVWQLFFLTIMVCRVVHRIILLTHFCCSQDWKMFWPGGSRWSESRRVLFFDWVTPVTRAAIKVTWVSRGEECRPNGLTRWRNRGRKRCWSIFCYWAHTCCEKTPLFFCRIFRKDISVLTHGHHEKLRFQGNKHFPSDQRLRLETPGWEVLDCEGNARNPAEVERLRERNMKALLVVRDR